MTEFPSHIIIEPTNQCNGRSCRAYCPRKIMDKEEPIKHMSLTMFDKIIDEIEQSGANPDIELHRRGESTLHPLVDYMIIRARQATTGRVMMATNLIATVPIHEILFYLDVINISLTPETNRDELELMLKIKNRHNLPIQIQVSIVNDGFTGEQIDTMKKLWKDMPGIDRFRIYEKHSQDGNPGSLPRTREGRVPCLKVAHQLAIHADGSIVQCNHRWLSEPNYGNIKDKTIVGVWHSKPRLDMVAQHASMRITDPICQKCDSWYPDDEQGTGELI